MKVSILQQEITIFSFLWIYYIQTALLFHFSLMNAAWGAAAASTTAFDVQKNGLMIKRALFNLFFIETFEIMFSLMMSALKSTGW